MSFVQSKSLKFLAYPLLTWLIRIVARELLLHFGSLPV